jgi:molybdate transport system substrate-binding protein
MQFARAPHGSVMRPVGIGRAGLILAVMVVLAGCRSRGRTEETEVMLAAAASMRNVLPALTAAYEKRHPGVKVAATYGASGDLRKQVEGGAPIDAVVFASAKPVDELIASGRVEPATRKVVATNELVLIGPKGGRPVTFATLDQLPPDERIAIGDPGSVPAGQYAREALEKLGKWEAVRGRLVFGGDVAAVLAYARRGEVAAAVVYRTDTRGVPDIAVFDTASGPWAPRPEVVVGVVKEGRAADQARAFLEFLSSPDGLHLLAENGFGAP